MTGDEYRVVQADENDPLFCDNFSQPCIKSLTVGAKLLLS